MKTIVIAVNDLIFGTTMREAVMRAGFAPLVVNNEAGAWKAATEPNAAGLVLDLNDGAMRPIELIQKLKKDATTVSILSFVPHVQVELKKSAEQAGSDRVVARSVFAATLKEWLAELAEAETNPSV